MVASTKIAYVSGTTIIPAAWLNDAGGYIYGDITTVASHATTAAIWANGIKWIDWTGTATTTAFPAAVQAGDERILKCAGASSFTAGTNLIIQGYANGNTIIVSANDIVRVFAVTTTQFLLTIITAVLSPATLAIANTWKSTQTSTPTNTATSAFAGNSTSAYGFIGTSISSIGVVGSSTSGAGVYGTSTSSYGGLFTNGGATSTNSAPLVISDSGNVAAPAHIAIRGSLWVTNTGILYINTDNATGWVKVGLQT